MAAELSPNAGSPELEPRATGAEASPVHGSAPGSTVELQAAAPETPQSFNFNGAIDFSSTLMISLSHTLAKNSHLEVSFRVSLGF